MKSLKEIKGLLFLEDVTIPYAKLKGGGLTPVTADLDLSKVEEIIDKSNYEEKVIKLLFPEGAKGRGGEKSEKWLCGTEEYELIIRLAKIIHRNTPSPAVAAVQDRNDVEFRLKRRVKKVVKIKKSTQTAN